MAQPFIPSTEVEKPDKAAQSFSGANTGLESIRECAIVKNLERNETESPVIVPEYKQVVEI